MWPYCNGIKNFEPGDPRAELFDWECIRGCVLGITSVLCSGVILYCVWKILPIVLNKRCFGLNLLMLSLASLQCILTSVKFILFRNQKLTFVAGYSRGLQTLLTCAFYAKSASQTWGYSFFSSYYFPILGLLILYLTIVFLVAVAQTELECYHPHWIIMSASQFIIWILFSVPALTEILRLRSQIGRLSSSRSRLAYNTYEGILETDELVEDTTCAQHRKLAVLLFANGVGAVSQLILDVWLQTFYSDERVCVVFYTGAEELLRIALKIISYDVPALATAYVYYFVPLKQFIVGQMARMESADMLDEAFSVELLET